MSAPRFQNELPDYGINHIIRRYAKYPEALPLLAHWEHGWTPLDEPVTSDTWSKQRVMLVFSRRRAVAWARSEFAKTKRVVVLGNPFAIFRRMENLSQRPDAEGTVVFPSHNTATIRAEYSAISLHRHLQSLPQTYKPISICLHQTDWDSNLRDEYEAHGYPVVTAGDIVDEQFPKRFFDLLSSFRFSASNQIGSYTFYAVDLGIPFFLLGDPPFYFNNGSNPDVPRGKYSILDWPIGRLAHTLFNTGPQQFTTPGQREFVRSELGIDARISSRRLRWILLNEYRKNKLLRGLARNKRRAARMIRRIRGAFYKLDDLNGGYDPE